MKEGRVPIDAGPFPICPHKDAKIIAADSNPALILAQVSREVASGRFPANETFLALIRELALTNLWFFGRFVASPALAIFEKLGDAPSGLHAEMCAFRQSDDCMRPGSRFCVTVPRGFWKTLIFTILANAWELFRNPDLAIKIFNAIVDNAIDMLGGITTIFMGNEMMQALAPESVPRRGAPHCNEKELLLPSRKSFATEPSVSVGGAGGASESHHYDMLDLDDLAGLDDLDIERGSSVSMMRKNSWMKTTIRTLLRSQRLSRIAMCATRFSLDDPPAIAVNDCRRFVGYAVEEFEEKPSGKWVVYNRLVIEDGVEVLPDVVSRVDFEKTLEEDPWTAMTQMMNRPIKSGLAEFAQYPLVHASLEWSEETEEYFLLRHPSNGLGNRDRRVRLASCDVVMAVDPAGTDKDISAKTSRTSIVVWAMDSEEYVYLLWRRVGFLDVMEMFDAIFEGHRRFGGVIRCVVVEANAMQTIIAPLLRRERSLRDEYINPKPIPAKGDKVARIRNNVGRFLLRGRVCLVEGQGVEFIEEAKVFPQSHFRLDTLDASEKALVELHKPLSEEEENAVDAREEAFEGSRSAVTGY